MYSALITIAILILGPTLAYVQSADWLATLGAVSAHHTVRRGAAVPGCKTLTDGIYHQDWETAPIGTGLSQPVGGCRTELRSQKRMGRALGGHQAPLGASAPISSGGARAMAGPLTGWSVAVAGGAGLHPNVLKAVQPWLRGGYLDGSGAGDPADNKHGTLRCRPPTSHFNSTFPSLKISFAEVTVRESFSFFAPKRILSRLMPAKLPSLLPDQPTEERCVRFQR